MNVQPRVRREACCVDCVAEDSRSVAKISVCALVGRSPPRPIISAAGADDVLAAAPTCHRELAGHPESEGERGEGGLVGGV